MNAGGIRRRLITHRRSRGGGHILRSRSPSPTPPPTPFPSLEELMLLGFISLLLTALEAPISNICVSPSLAATWHPCKKKSIKPNCDGRCVKKGKVALMSTDAIHQLHKFVFILALFHVLYCITTLALGSAQMRKWKSWENLTKSAEYQYMNDPERIRFIRETTFGRRHLKSWSQFPILLWAVCFFRQFFRSVAKVDYLTLRHGFIRAHLAPGSEMAFDFRKYITLSLEEDFKSVVGISPVMWFFAVLYLLGYTDGLLSYYWLPFIPLIIILLVGAKLQVIITKMGLRIQERGNVIQGSPLVQPDDDLFWFKSPRILLFLIHFVMFQNAFQLAFIAFTWYKYGMSSCFHNRQEVLIRISMGVINQFVCSYVTLPLYSLVTQMGSNIKPTMFCEQVGKGLGELHQAARKSVHNSDHVTLSFSSRSSRGSSPIHLLHHYQESSSDSVETYPGSSLQHNESNRENKGSYFHQVNIDESSRDHSRGLQQPAVQFHTVEQEGRVTRLYPIASLPNRYKIETLKINSRGFCIPKTNF